MATVTGVIGDGVGDGEGRAISREMVVNRTIEGEMSLSMRSAISVAEFVAVNIMVVGVVRLSSKNEVKERERKGEKRKETKKEKVQPKPDSGDDGEVRESRTDGGGGVFVFIP